MKEDIVRGTLEQMRDISKLKPTHFYSFISELMKSSRYSLLRSTYIVEGLMADFKDNFDGQEYRVEIYKKEA